MIWQNVKDSELRFYTTNKYQLPAYKKKKKKDQLKHQKVRYFPAKKNISLRALTK